MKQQNKYEKLFDEFLDLMEFRLVRHQNDYNKYTDEYGHWSLIDLQGADLGNIEGDRFESAAQILDRMDIYIRDYLIESIKDILEDEFDVDASNYSNWSDLLELAKKYLSYDYGWLIDVLDMICNHFDEINLENCIYEEEE